jgi:hypothetical protein
VKTAVALAPVFLGVLLPFTSGEVVGGRIRGSDTDLGIRERMTLEEAFRQLERVTEKVNREPR